jgi:branched-chain amino acid transport system ATP-binding protein
MLLQLENVEAGYGRSQVLFGMSFGLEAGEVVTMIGRNGMGKTTTVNALMGIIPSAGRICLAGEGIGALPSYRRARLGLGYVPEGRQIFPKLSVQENLIATARMPESAPARWTLNDVYALFPRLAERRNQNGTLLSGGEQQMLAIGRALMTNPRILILDEATEGLAPLIRQEIWTCLANLKRDGQAMLVVDKNLSELAAIANRHIIVEKGRVVWSGTTEELRASPQTVETYLSV